MAQQRRVLRWTAMSLLIGQVGCAAARASVKPELATASWEAEARQRCEAYAKAELAARGKPAAGSIVGAVALAPIAFFVGAIGAAAGAPQALGLWVAPFEIAGEAPANARHNRSVRQTAFDACMEPERLTATLGPDHPDVARSLETLALGYVALGDRLQAQAAETTRDADQLRNIDRKFFESQSSLATSQRARAAAARRAAEPLYARVLAIREKAFGPDNPEVAATLEAYALLLRTINRKHDADAMSVRAKAIRAREEARSQSAGTAEPE